MASTKSPSYAGVNIYTTSEEELCTIPGLGKIYLQGNCEMTGGSPGSNQGTFVRYPHTIGKYRFLGNNRS